MVVIEDIGSIRVLRAVKVIEARLNTSAPVAIVWSFIDFLFLRRHSPLQDDSSVLRLTRVSVALVLQYKTYESGGL